MVVEAHLVVGKNHRVFPENIPVNINELNLIIIEKISAKKREALCIEMLTKLKEEMDAIKLEMENC